MIAPDCETFQQAPRDALRELGVFNAERGKWEQAAAAFAQAIERGPAEAAPRETYEALLRLATGNLDAYRRACAELIERLGDDEKPSAFEVARACAFGPEAVSDYPRLLELAESAASTYSSRSAERAAMLGAVFYRAGKFDDAIEQLNLAIQLHALRDSARERILLAMAHYRLNHDENARRAFANAIELLAREADLTNAGGITNDAAPWHKRLELQLLLRDAQTLLGQ
jgi:tetratricopeptide (TPR) repeat protein